MNNVDATVQKDEYGNLLECVPPVTLEEYELGQALPSDKLFRNRGDK